MNFYIKNEHHGVDVINTRTSVVSICCPWNVAATFTDPLPVLPSNPCRRTIVLSSADRTWAAELCSLEY